MPMTIDQAYSVLEVSSSSSETEVKKAYKRLALQVRLRMYEIRPFLMISSTSIRDRLNVYGLLLFSVIVV